MRKTPSLRIDSGETLHRTQSGSRPNTTKNQEKKHFMFDIDASLKTRGPLSPSNGNQPKLFPSTSSDNLYSKQSNTANSANSSKFRLDPTKQSSKRNGKIAGYAANTNQGLYRDYNEDRVSIILNIMKPGELATTQWPRSSFFGVYDGHGGTNCADFLRDNLHQFVIRQPSFPSNVKEAILTGFKAAENAFLAKAKGEEEIDRSGSCAIVVMVVGDFCYVANVGDSRAILSANNGSRCIDLSRDHKPIDDHEFDRITKGGGKVYQTHIQNPKMEDGSVQTIIGPHRVFPGRLSVSRTIGDLEAKDPELGGNPSVVIATPEIKCFKISPEHDFIILGSLEILTKKRRRNLRQDEL